MSKGIFQFRILPDLPSATEWKDHVVQAWVNLVNRNVRYIACYNITITPTSVGANSSDDQTFSVPGLTTTMNVVVEPPDLTADLIVGYSRVSANDTLLIRFGNISGGAKTPASGIYKVTAIRQ